MSERPVPAHEVRALAKKMRSMVMTLKQGKPDGDKFIEGAIYAFAASANALTVLSVVASAEDVNLDLPDASAYEPETDRATRLT